MPKNLRQAINLHIEQVDAPTVRIIVPDVSRTAEREQEVLFLWSEPVDFSLTTGIPATSVGTTGVVLSNLVKETPLGYRATMMLPENAMGTGYITVKACSVQGESAAGPTYPAIARIDYDTRYTQESFSAQCQLAFVGSSLPGIDNPDGFLNVLETIEHGAYQYIVVQIRKEHPNLQDTGVPVTVVPMKQAGAVLYRLNMATCAFTVLRTYQAVTLAARSFYVKDDRVYWFEGSNYAYLNQGQTRNLDPDEQRDISFKLTRVRGVPHDWKRKIGNIASIANDESSITDHGINFVSATPAESPHGVHDPYYGIHGGTVSPMIDDDNLKVIAGYGDFSEVTDSEKEASKLENMQTVKLGTALSRKVPVFYSNEQTAYDSIKDLAARSLSVYGLDAGRFFFEPRLPLHAKFGSIASTNINYTELSQDLTDVPTEGYVSIGSELIKYSGVTDTQIQNIERAQEGTTQGTYTTNDIIYFIDHIVSLRPDTIADQIDDISASDDRDNVYNTISVQYGDDTYPLNDPDSVDKHGVEELDVSAGLHSTERDLAKWLAEMHLFIFKDLQSVVNMRLNYSPHVKIKDTIFIICRDRLFIESPAIVVHENLTMRKKASWKDIRAVTIPLRN